MRRNIVLAASSLTVLLLLFAVYSLIVVDPYADDDNAAALLSGLPDAEPLDSGGMVRIGDVVMPVPKGGATRFTVFDEYTGRPRYNIKCTNWSKAPDSINEFDIVAPELSFITPRGERITISADSGRVTGARVEKTNPEWKYGRLQGNARIVIDRAAVSLDQADWPPPEELIIIEMDEVSFDLELGRVSTDGSLTLEGPDFDISGVGLDLTWNDADKRIETLRIAQGRELVLKNLAGFLGTSDDDAADAGDGEEPVSSAPASASQPVVVQEPKPRPRAAVSYLCTLSGPVRAERWAGGKRVASIDAGGLRLLFDLGGNSGVMQRDPADRSKTRSDGRLVVKWSGELLLTPTEGPKKPIRFRKHDKLAPPRRRQRLTALGPLVILRQYGGSDTSIRCGGLEYYEDTGQVWLSGDADGRVTIDLGGGQTAVASGVYIDQKQGLIKLVGDVQLDMQRPAEAAERNASHANASAGTSVYCSQMAELVLRRSPESGGNAEFGLDLGGMANGLEAARFYGDVCVNLEGEQLFAERLEMRFRSGEKGESIETLLERVIADGGTRLANDEGAIDCGRLVLSFEAGEGGRAYPSEFDARGAVHMQREDMTLRGDRVLAKLRAPRVAATGDSSRGRLNVRVLDVIGRAEFVDRVNKVGARGDRIRTWIQDGELAKARVTGSAETLALVHASPYTVRGREIDIEVEQLTLHVDGPSRVAFFARRGLRGQRRNRRQLVLVAGERSLHIDGHGNRVRVEGDVTVDSGDDHVTASAVTLLLEDVADASDSAERRGGAGRAAWALLAAASPGVSQTRLLGSELIAGANGAYRALTRSNDKASSLARTPRVGRKEPVRMIAENAVVVSETLVPGSDNPLVHMSLTGADGGPVELLEVDINARQMQTTGKTILFLSDYRADPRASQSASGSIVPSDLMRGGPSQTVLMCDKSLIYVLGEDGPQRRDSVLLYDRVVMIHRAGRDIVAFDEQLAGRLDPATLARMKRRHTTLDCDRLECLFGRTTAGGGRDGFGANLPGSRLVWLNATGDVQLNDSPGEVTTEVYADRLTFDRDAGQVSIFGSERIDARVYRTNSATNSFERPFVGPRLTIDLRTNTIKALRLTGEVRP